MATYKIVIDLDVQCEDADEVAAYLEEWYAPGSEHETGTGQPYTVVVSMITNDGAVDPGTDVTDG